jgi:hypothetical protein
MAGRQPRNLHPAAPDHPTLSETMDTLDNVRKSATMSSEFFVEAVAYQQAAIEEMERRAFSVEAMHPIKDKRARLRMARGTSRTASSASRAPDASSSRRM